MKLKKAVKTLLHTPMPPMWPWNRTPRQQERSFRLRVWSLVTISVIGIVIYKPTIVLVVLLAILCGGVIAFFLQQSQKDGEL